MNKEFAQLKADNEALRKRIDALEAKAAPPRPTPGGTFRDNCGLLRNAAGHVVTTVTDEEVAARYTMTDAQRRELHKPMNVRRDGAGNWQEPGSNLWRDHEGRLIPNYGKEQPPQEVPVVPTARHRGGFAERLVDAATPLRAEQPRYYRASEQGE